MFASAIMPQVCLSLQKILGGGSDGYTPCKYRIRGHERKQVNDTYVTNFLCHAVHNTLLFFPPLGNTPLVS